MQAPHSPTPRLRTGPYDVTDLFTSASTNRMTRLPQSVAILSRRPAALLPLLVAGAVPLHAQTWGQAGVTIHELPNAFY